MRTFHLIWALTASLPAGVIYLMYTKWLRDNSDFDFAFYAVEILVIGTLYYLIAVRQRRIFMETNIGMRYYHFGRLNAVLKILAVLLAFAFVILLGRVIANFANKVKQIAIQQRTGNTNALLSSHAFQSPRGIERSTLTNASEYPSAI